MCMHSPLPDNIYLAESEIRQPSGDPWLDKRGDPMKGLFAAEDIEVGTGLGLLRVWWKEDWVRTALGSYINGWEDPTHPGINVVTFQTEYGLTSKGAPYEPVDIVELQLDHGLEVHCEASTFIEAHSELEMLYTLYDPVRASEGIHIDLQSGLVTGFIPKQGESSNGMPYCADSSFLAYGEELARLAADSVTETDLKPMLKKLGYDPTKGVQG